MSSPLISRLALRHPARLRTTAVRRWVHHENPGGHGNHYPQSPIPPPPPPPRVGTLMMGVLAVTGLGCLATGTAVLLLPFFAETEPLRPEKVDIIFEKPRSKPPTSKEENREMVSPQHVQVKKSWENPGVYAWGSNTGKVVAPESKEAFVKTPRRLSYFDGQILRDLKLDRDFGAAVTENGDLVQWGTAFSKGSANPIITLKGKDLVKIAISRDRIIALSSGGSVYSIPVASADQTAKETASTSSSWIPFWSSAPPTVSYRILKPKSLGWGEKVVDVSSGLEHCLMLTSKGRVFSAASSSEDFPARGQLGIPGLTWQTRPEGPYDQPYEIGALHRFKVKAIATGDFHSLALDSDGRVFSFGDNSSGQLGFQSELGSPYVDVPAPLPVTALYNGTKLLPKVTSIAAGGLNSYFTVDAKRVQGKGNNAKELVPVKDLGKTISETWACGEGIYGSLGTGKWTHISTAPTKIKALSNLYEYDEATNTIVPIRPAHLSVGATHVCAVLDNATHLSASGQTSANDTNYGADTLWWGGNESYQLGTGKRSNANTPLYIGPLDGGQQAGSSVVGRLEGTDRFQVTPRKTVRLGEGGSGRKVSIEQRVECGRLVTAVYTGT